MDLIFASYNQVLELIPMPYRLPLAIIIIIFLVFSLIKFLKKHLIWIVVFILLLPAAWPAIRQLGLAGWDLIQKIPK